jgi:hypothetical protein
LAYSFLKLLEDDALRESMGRAGRKRAMDDFTWDKVAKTMLVCYQKLSSERYHGGHVFAAANSSTGTLDTSAVREESVLWA